MADVVSKEYLPVRIAVFPVAGMGTRFLPATKNVPKEMMPLIDRPLIHYGVEEAVESGCTDVVFVTGAGKRSIGHYFEPADEMVTLLRKRGKNDLAEAVDKIHKLANFHFTLQERPLGLGHAVLCAEELCHGEAFFLLLPDDVMEATPTIPSQLDAVRRKYGGSVLAVEKVPENEVSRYGVIDADEIEPGIYRVKGLVEKPKREDAPSNLAIIGRYLLSPAIFRHLKDIPRGAGGEYQLTDAICSMLSEEPVYATIYKGRRFDCGVKEGWISATVTKAMEDPKLRKIVLEVVKNFNTNV